MSLDSLQNLTQGIVLHGIALGAVLGLVLGDDLSGIHHFQALQRCKQNQMGLQGQEAFVALFPDSLFQQLGNLAVAGAAQNVLVIAGHGILDVDVLHVRSQQFIGRQRVLTALDEIGKIKSAFKIIFSKDKNISWGERIFEASKVLAAGVVGIIGFSLNELIAKGLMSIGIPFASFIAECLSGLFAGIMSAIVIMLFDKFKKHFMTRSVAVQKLQQRSRLMCVHTAQIQISSLQLDLKVMETYNFIGQVFSSMQEIHNNIQEQYEIGRQKTILLAQEVNAQDERNRRLSEMKTRYINDDNF